MTDFDFGYLMVRHCHVAQIKAAILASVRATGTLCEAERGFIDRVDDGIATSATDRKFLRAVAKAMEQQRMEATNASN